MIHMPWCGGEWVRVSPAQPARPELVDLSGSTRLPTTGRRRQAQATVRVLCPAEAAAPDEPTKVSETDAQRRARQAKDAAAAWT